MKIQKLRTLTRDCKKYLSNIDPFYEDGKLTFGKIKIFHSIVMNENKVMYVL